MWNAVGCPVIGDDYVHASNIRSFEGCTVIQGSIKIFQTSLSGYITSVYHSLSANVDYPATYRITGSLFG